MNLSLDASDETPPSVTQFLQNEARPFVRKSPQSLSDLSDAELQDYIVGCAEHFLAAHRRYQNTGCFADAGDRDGWWIAESQALVERGNRPQIVARMEAERNLA